MPAYDARARIWRDWGFPQLGMPDADRAIYYAPRSAAAQNTQGTLLAALGRFDEAQRAFEKAIALDPEASFARTNLCQVRQFVSPDLASSGALTAGNCAAADVVDAPSRSGK